MSTRPSSCPKCGHELSRARSPQDHRRFFAVIQRAYENWNHAHEFQPTSSEHLRAFLLCRAGYHDVTTVPVEFVEGEPQLLKLVSLAVEASVKAALASGDFAFTRIHGEGIAVFRPKSISWSTIDQKAFGPIREAVEEVIEAETGIKIEDMLKERAA